MPMGRSIYIDQVQVTKRKWGLDIGLAFLLGIGGIITFLSSFAIEWKLDEAFEGGVKNGLLTLWNRIAEKLGESDYYLLSRYEVKEGGYGLAVLILAILLICLALAIIRTGNRWLLLIYPGALGVMALATSLMPHYVGVILLLAGVLAAYLRMSRGEDGGGGVVWPILAVFVLALLLGAGVRTFGAGFLSLPEKVGKVGEYIKEKEVELRYGMPPLTGGQVDGRQRSKGKGVALEVTMEKPKPLYLRGFVGETYLANKWTQLSDLSHYEKRQLDRRLWSSGYRPFGSISAANKALDPKTEEQNVSVEVASASRQYAFTPYEIAEEKIEGTKNVAGSFITNTVGQPLHKYSYLIGEEGIETWPDKAGQLFAASGNAAVKKLLKNETYINQYIYEKYTEVPDEYRKAIYSQLGTSGNQEKGHIDYKQAISKVRNYMDSKITYSEKGWKKSSGEGIKDFFNYKKGYDVQYAAVATFMFRYYGIPARYVEGYLLTPEDVKGKKAGQVMEVLQKKAHSWPEIYIDGYGWVPIEVASPFYKVMPEPDWSRGLESKNLLKPFNQPENATTQTAIQESQRPQQKGEGMRSFLLWILLGTLILLIAIAAGLLGRSLIAAMKRRKGFFGEDPKQAMCIIYAYIKEKKWKPEVGDLALLDKAAYSQHPMKEEDRKQILGQLPFMRKRKQKEGKAARRRAADAKQQKY